MLHAATFHRHIIRSATTNELNGRPSRVSERLAKASRLEKNRGGNAVESWNETTERVKEVTESKAPFVVLGNMGVRTRFPVRHTQLLTLFLNQVWNAQCCSTFPFVFTTRSEGLWPLSYFFLFYVANGR